MSLTKNRLLRVWLCSAAVVTLARFFNAADLGELPIQIQAAQHLLAGKGLSVYSSPGEDDLSQPAELVRLAHFPAGFSLYAAGLMAMGVSLAALVKLYFAVTTLLGWWGWGNLAYYFFADGLRRNRGWTWAACVIAACTPLLSTLLWKGTDTFLWAAIPWVLLWITQASKQTIRGGRWFDWLAGLLCGLSFVMRYAGLFLVIYATGVILCQSATRPRMLAARFSAFAAGLLPFLIPQIYLSHFTSNAEAIPDIITFQGGAQGVLSRLKEGLPFLTSANIALVWWMPHQAVELLTQTGKHASWLILASLVGWASFPFLVAWKIGCRGLGAASRDLRMVATGFLVTLPLFLLGWTGLAEYMYVVEPRYYLPLIPLLVLVVYQLATPPEHNESRFERWARKGSLIYLMGYLCFGVISAARLVVPGEVGINSRAKLMAMRPERFHWPSMKLSYEFSPGRAYILEIFKDEPGTVLVTNREEWFYAEPDTDRARVRRPKDLQATYVSGPARILIAIQDSAPGALTSVAWYGHYDKRWTAEYFQNLSDVRLLRTFPEEEIRVVEARVAEGDRIPLKKETAHMKDLELTK
jgi:hypothetical protein